jgi:hypothetical protein
MKLEFDAKKYCEGCINYDQCHDVLGKLDEAVALECLLYRGRFNRDYILKWLKVVNKEEEAYHD